MSEWDGSRGYGSSGDRDPLPNIDELKNRIIELETERDMYKGRYEDLCAMLRKKANKDRNNDV